MQAFHSVILHREDDLPIQLEDRFVIPAEAPTYLDQDFSSETPHNYLMTIAPLGRGEHVVEAGQVGGGRHRRMLAQRHAGLTVQLDAGVRRRG